MSFPTTTIRREGAVAPKPQASTSIPKSSPTSESRFARLLDGFGKQADRGERLMDRASSAHRGRDLDARQLLALQAGIYRYGEVVELGSKLVERGSSALRTIVQGGGGS